MLTVWEANDTHADVARSSGASLTEAFGFGLMKSQQGLNRVQTLSKNEFR